MAAENHPTTPEITSFIIRFISAESAEMVSEEGTTSALKHTFRGVIRHIQTNRELAFTHWKEAEAFIGQFVQLEPGTGSISSTQQIPGNEPQV